MLEAVEPARNIRRAYVIERRRDLFDRHIVIWSWGRIGCGRMHREQAFESETEAIDFVRLLLRRRATAPRRIGACYQRKAWLCPER